MFYSLLLFNLVTDALLDIGWLAAGDMRIKWTIVDGVYCLWVLVLGNFFRSRKEAVAVFLLVVAAFTYWVLPHHMNAADNWKAWVELTTRIMEGWATIIAGLVMFVAARTYLQYKVGGGFNDLIVNPRKRFLLPIGAWAAIKAIPLAWIPASAGWFETARFPIAAHIMVWGWVFLELKFFFQARYWRRKYGKH